MNKQFKCPEVTFFEVYQQEKTVKIDGELVYRDGELELIQYTNCYLDYEKLDQKGYKTFFDLLSNNGKRCWKMSDQAGLDLITGYYEQESAKPLDLFSLNEEIPDGYYMHVWNEPSKQNGSNNGQAARIWFSSSEAEDDETEFDTVDPVEIIRLFMDFATENGIMDKKLKIHGIEFVALDEDAPEVK